MALTATQLDERRHGIGGSDAGAVLGLNPYRTPLDVYLEKRGETEPPDLSDNAAVHWGERLEDLVADEYQRRTGARVQRRNPTLHHPEHDFMLAHVDRMVVGESKILECKTAGAFMAPKWGEDGMTIADAATEAVPASYVAQIHHYMVVLGVDLADLAVLIGGRDFRIYHFERDQDFTDILVRAEAEFWRGHVEAGMPPAPATIDDIRALYPTDDGSTLTADSALLDTVSQLRACKESIKVVGARKEELELELKAAMGNASVLLDAEGGTLCTWKAQTANRLDTKALRAAHPDLAGEFTKASESRVLRLK